MSDMEERLRRLGPETTAPTIDGLERRTNRRRIRRHRLVAGATAAAFVAVVSAAVVATRDDERPVTDVSTTDPAPTTTTEDREPIRYPALLDERCVVEYGIMADLARESPGGYGVPQRVFSEPTTPIAVQIVGEADQVPDHYAVVLRVPDADRSKGQWAARVVDDSGVGDARVELDDGTALYVRSRGLDEDELSTLVSSIEPRPASAVVPGVDLVEASDVSILAEAGQLNSVDALTNTCVLDGVDESYGTDARIEVGVLSGAMVDVLTWALDRPSPFFLREQADGSLLVVWGPRGLVDESTLDHVVEGTRRSRGAP